jgi:hypothetical protein
VTWNPIEQPTDYALIAGKRTPGLCDVVGAGSPRAWDERRGYGLSGSTVVFRGTRLADFTLRLRLYTVDDWSAWAEFKPTVLRPPAGERARALDIVHPQLAEVEIAACVIKDVKAPVKTSPEGEWTIEIMCQEFRRPVVAVAPIGSSAPRVESYAEGQAMDELKRASDDFAAESRAGGLIP